MLDLDMLTRSCECNAAKYNESTQSLNIERLLGNIYIIVWRLIEKSLCIYSHHTKISYKRVVRIYRFHIPHTIHLLPETTKQLLLAITSWLSELEITVSISKLELSLTQSYKLNRSYSSGFGRTLVKWWRNYITIEIGDRHRLSVSKCYFSGLLDPGLFTSGTYWSRAVLTASPVNAAHEADYILFTFTFCSEDSNFSLDFYHFCRYRRDILVIYNACNKCAIRTVMHGRAISWVDYARPL